MLLVGDDGDAQRRLHLVERAGDGVDGLGLRLVASTPLARMLALELLHRDHGAAVGVDALEEGAACGGVDALDRTRAEMAVQFEAAAVGVDEVERGVRDAARLLEDEMVMRTASLRSMTLVEHVAQGIDARLELVLLAEHPLLHLPLDGGAQRIEQDQDDERRHQRVEEEHARLIGRDPRHQKAVDGRQDQHEGGDDHHRPRSSFRSSRR